MQSRASPRTPVYSWPVSSRTAERDGRPVAVTAIVPLKALDRAKQRLAGHLTVDERRTLMRDAFTHVLEVCLAIPSITRVLAVVGDDAGADLAGHGVTVLRDPGGGLNRAIAHSTGEIGDGDASLVVVADLPDLSPADLTALTTLATGRCVLVAPTHDGGTGALLRRPPAVIAPAFGGASAAAHLDAAARAGVRAGMVWRAGLARDVDRPADLDRYAGRIAGGPRA